MDRRPILVTGAHRSGTTWVGRMLTAGGQAAYISEPLNRWHRPGVLSAPVERWYTYLCEENEAIYLPALRQTLALRYHALAELRSLRSGKDVLRMGRDWSAFAAGRLFGRRPLLKDPFAVFSASWFARRFGCAVIVTVRHPAAFVSSLARLDWPFDFADLLGQPLLMRDWLEPFRQDMQACQADPQDVIGQSALLWRVIYHAVYRMRESIPGFRLVRHEDLARDPLEGFRELYQALGLEFTPRAGQAIARYSRDANPAELSRRRTHSVRLASRASLENWKRRLGREQIERIRALTADVAGLYYAAGEWE